MAFANIGVFTLSDAFDEILEPYGNAGGGSASDTAVEDVFQEFGSGANGFDGF